jgi:hypothetical protein
MSKKLDCTYTLNPKHKSLEDIIEKYWVEGFGKLDLGCGYYKPLGYVGIDDLSGSSTQIANTDNYPDIFMDLNKEIPFDDSTCSEIRSSHFLEHSNLDHIINESYRLLHSEGYLLFTVPYASSAEGMYPGHNTFLTEKWFEENINFQDKFTICNVQFKPSDYWKGLPLIYKVIFPFKYARIFLFNACSEMTMLCKPNK